MTYNYGRYYYEALSDKYGDDNEEIRTIYEMSEAKSIESLEHMINRIKEKYPELETDEDYWKAVPGNAIKPLFQLKAMAELRPDGIWDGD